MNRKITTFIANQFRRPTGLLGKCIAEKMKKGNKPDYEWTLSNMHFDNAKNILEIGYGTGVVLAEIAQKYPSIHFYGIDFSKVMFKKAKKNCSKFIKDGRMKLAYGDVLEFSTEVKYDIIFAINVIYFWNDLEIYFNKINQMLNDGGTLYLFMADIETIERHSIGQTNVFNRYKVEQVLDIFKKCGLNNCKTIMGDLQGNKCHCFIIKR